MATAPTVDIKIDFVAFSRAVEQCGLGAQKMADAMAKASTSLVAAFPVRGQGERERVRRLRQQFMQAIEESERGQRALVLTAAPPLRPSPLRGISLDGRF